MPRRKAIRCPKQSGEVRLDVNLREALLTGMEFVPGLAGLNTKSDWLRAWNAFGEQLLPEFVAQWPGVRPDGMRMAGIIPPRELICPLPASHGFWIQSVEDDITGEVMKHVCGVCRCCRCEADELLAAGIIDQAEHDAHFDSGAHEYHCTGLSGAA